VTAPTRDLTYQEALVVAASLQAAQAFPSPVATVQQSAEATIRARETAADWARRQLRRLWLPVNPYDRTALAEFVAQAAVILQTGQTATARAAAAGVSNQVSSLGIALTAMPSNPVDVRSPAIRIIEGVARLSSKAVMVEYGGANRRVTDYSNEAIMQRPAAVYRYAVSQGATETMARQESLSRLEKLTDDNMMLAQRLAEMEALNQAHDLDQTITGYRRVVHPELSRGGACGMCIVASDRKYYITDLKPIHARCNCTVAAITTDFDPGEQANSVDLSRFYEEAGSNYSQYLKKTRYQVDQHGEFAAVLVPQKRN